MLSYLLLVGLLRILEELELIFETIVLSLLFVNKRSPCSPIFRSYPQMLPYKQCSFFI